MATYANLFLKTKEVPFLNHVVVSGIWQSGKVKKTEDGTEYIEAKLFTSFDYRDFSNIFYSDKDKLLLNANLPVYFYPFNERLQNVIENQVKATKQGDFVTIRGYLETIYVNRVDRRFMSVKTQSETVIQGLEFQSCLHNFEKPDLREIGVPVNFTTFTGVILDMEESTARDKSKIAHLAIGIPKILKRRVGIIFENGNSEDIDIVHGIMFTKEAEYVLENFTKGDTILVTGRYIPRFFKGAKGLDLFKKLHRFYVIDMFTVSKIGRDDVKKEFVKKIAEKMKQDSNNEEISSFGDIVLGDE